MADKFYLMVKPIRHDAFAFNLIMISFVIITHAYKFRQSENITTKKEQGDHNTIFISVYNL